MKITIATGAMPFGPDTPSRASLGGSETAALMMGKALAARGHDVTHFCNLPKPPAPDAFESGTVHADKVRYVDLSHYQNFVTINECDLLIAVRDPQFVAIPVQAKKKVLWTHDIATVRGMKRVLEQMQFTFDEIWTVSEWHRYQVNEVTGYPLNRIVALRNGIVEYNDLIPFGRSSKQLIYASRPERGLWNLVQPGGVMENLPDYTLLVAMYEHFPEHMREFYTMIFERIRVLPNVQLIGGKPNKELRQIIGESAAYIYPTQFEETSCILARECIEQQTPFITTSVGALPETLGDEGIYFEDWLFANGITEPERGTPGWCKLFAQCFRDAMSQTEKLIELKSQMSQREDLYWDGVAAMAEDHSSEPTVTLFSRLFSLVQDGDVIPAMALMSSAKEWHGLTEDTMSLPLASLHRELKECYAFINGDIGKYYDDFYRSKSGKPDSELVFITQPSGTRHVALMEQIAALPPNSTVFEYGCGPGHILGPMAKAFPHINFHGFDFSQAAVDVVNKGADDHQLQNLSASSDLSVIAAGQFDAVICSEVLEHVVEPWKLAQEVESYCRPGGLVIFTVPFGPWEPVSYERQGHWKDRFHIWAIDREMLVEMLGEKQEAKTMMLISGMSEWQRPVGNIVFTYKADHKPTTAINPLSKALRHHARETCAAAIIAYNNEDTIVRLLNSLDKKVQFVQIAHGPSTDHTLQVMEQWFDEHPWMRASIFEVPKIEPRVFGFDDARNASIEGLEDDFEWFLWIDTDEYLSGEIRQYLRPSALDSYLVAQHHFTVEPRGNPPEIDRPARLMRLDRGIKAHGHIHEHFEVPTGGPGIAYFLPDIDIGHPGYVNEQTRRARFFRNFPFLEWEHEEGGERKLHKFLWFRDIIHRMRFTQDQNERLKLANEAVSYYNENHEAMSAYGPGLFMSLKYLAEANMVLNIGTPLKVTVQFEDRSAMLEGRFTDFDQVNKVFKQLLEPELQERSGRYY